MFDVLVSTLVRERWLCPEGLGLCCAALVLLLEEACDMLRETNHFVVVLQVTPWERRVCRGEDVMGDVVVGGEEAETRKGICNLARSLVGGSSRERSGGEVGFVMVPMVGSKWTVMLQERSVVLRLGLLRDRRREGRDAGKESLWEGSVGERRR